MTTDKYIFEVLTIEQLKANRKTKTEFYYIPVKDSTAFWLPGPAVVNQLYWVGTPHSGFVLGKRNWQKAAYPVRSNYFWGQQELSYIE